MKVDGGGQAQSQAMQQIRMDRTDQKSDKKDVGGDLNTIEKFNFKNGEAKAKGVLKKLQEPESHFNGVADLRLRINFDDQLQGLVIPPISEPKGGGTSYNRFFEIYESLETTHQGTSELETKISDNLTSTIIGKSYCPV